MRSNSFSAFNALWEQSKAQHHSDAATRASKFQKEFEKWNLLLFIPFLRQRFVAERDVVRGQISKIVTTYAPQIQRELQRWEDGFNQWEDENSGPSLCGSGEAIRTEQQGKENAKRLSSEMVSKIEATPHFSRHFHPIEKPSRFVENPYPGFLTSERAQNYCKHLIEVFS